MKPKRKAVIKIGVYKITCSNNGRIYFGSSTTIPNRMYSHRTLLRSGRHHVSELQADFNTYGEKSFIFEVVKLCSKSEMVDLEKTYIRKNIGKVYNHNAIRQTRLEALSLRKKVN